MGVYGTYGAFNGLGKPSIKLEFEDNEALLDFQRRMQEGGDGGNYTQSQLDDAVDEHNTIGWGIKPEIPEGWHVVKTKSAPDGFDVIVKGEPSFKLTTTGWSFKNAMDAALIEKKKGLKATKGGELEGVDEDIIDKLKSLAVSGQYYNGDLSKKDIESEFGKGEPFTIHNNTRLHKYPTPVGIVNFTENNIDKLQSRKRTQYFYLIKPTLLNPLLVFEDRGALVYLKTFKIDGKCIFFVVPVGDYQNVENGVKSAYEKGIEYVKEKIKGGRVRYADPNISSAQLPTLGEATSFIVGLPFEGYTENGAKSCVSEEKSLGGYGDFYTVRDMRKRSRKEPGDVATNKNLQFTKDNDRKINNFDRSLYELTNGVNSWNYGEKLKDTHWRALTVKYNSDNGKYFTTIQLFFPYTLRRDLDKPTFTGYAGDVDADVDLNNLYNYSYYIDSRNYVDRQKLEGFVKDDYYKTLLIEAIKSGYKQLQQRLINAKNSRLTNTPSNIAEAERLIKYYKMLYSDPSKYDLLDKAYGGGFKNISNKLKKFLGEGGYGLGAPGDTYIITDTRTRARKDLEDTAALKKYDIRKFSGEELQKMQADDPLLYEQIKSDLGKTANDTLYNNLEILDFRGMQPTYRQLPNYDAFFKPAANKNSLKGFGLADTKKLIADICRNHYKECAAIARHLKAETKLQSAFNLWHWLHHNVRYEYDREGREEVRTPARVWADRHRGVDCDCLSVFAWCVLKCMGYDPAFELAAFRNKPAYSHIYINLDGIVIDRVWFIFNSRPPFITKTELFKVGMLDNLGQLF